MSDKKYGLNNFREDKDMSEEKECKHCKLIMSPSSEGEFCSLVCSLRARNISLESRLKEAERERDIAQTFKGMNWTKLSTSAICAQNKFVKKYVEDLEAELKEAQKNSFVAKNVLCSSSDILNCEQRLSKAEAEIGKYETFIALERVQAYQQMMEANEKLRNRLSHLMDVAGKMAGALKKIAKLGENEIYEPFACTVAFTALAEWDGIKDGGK